MNQRQQILQVLFENCVLEGNFSELARTLGYTKKSRSTVERVRKGDRNLTEKKLDTLYKKINEEYLINDSDIATIATSVEYGKKLYCLLREAYGVDDNRYIAAFGAIVTENYSAVSGIDDELVDRLKEMKLQEPEIYFGMLAYFYIMYKGVFPYTKKMRKHLPEQLSELNELLYELYPGSNRSYEAAKESIKINLADEYLSILKLIYNFRHIIRGYVDNAYFENFLREMGILLDVGDDSFWVVPGETFHEGCVLWYLSVIPTKSKHHGAYTAMKLRAASSATDSFELIEAYNIMFIIDEDYDNIPLMQAYEVCTGKVEYALFNYDEDARLLKLEFDDMPQATFNLPTALKCLNHTKPEGKNEKIWANIIAKLLDDKCMKYILAAINSSSNSNIEYLGEYDVTNVCIDRKSVTVTFEKETANGGVELKNYSIAFDSYAFFEELTPFEFASVVRYKDTGELAIAWNNLGQNVPLCEFNEISS